MGIVISAPIPVSTAAPLPGSEVLVRRVMAVLPTAMYVCDATGRIVHYNDRAVALWGREPCQTENVDRFCGSLRLYLPDGTPLPHDQTPVARALREGVGCRNAQVIVERPDGSRRVALANIEPIRADDGGVIGAINVVVDITDERDARDRLASAYALLEGITRGTDELIAALDGQYRFTYCNDAYAREFRRLWGRDAAPGLSLVEALAAEPVAQRKARALWARALRGETFHVTLPFGPGGEAQQVYDLRFNPIVDTEGEAIGAAHIIRNVTEQTRMQQALADSERRFRQLAEAMPQLVWTADADGRVDYYNARAAAYEGLVQQDDGRWAWQPMIHPDDLARTEEAWTRATRQGEGYACEHRVRMADGAYRWHLSRATPMTGSDGKVKWYGTATDIDQLKAAEDALRDAHD